MLDDLINKIKGMMGQSEDSDEEGTSSIKIDGAKENDDSDESDEEEDAVAKKKTMIIRGIVISVIAWVAVDEFLLEKELPPQAIKKTSQTDLKRKGLNRKKPDIIKESPVVAVPESTVNAITEATPEITPDVTATVMAEETPEVMAEETPAVVAEETPEVMAEETPEVMAEATPAVMAEETPEPSNVNVTDQPIDSMLSDLDKSIAPEKKGLNALGEALEQMMPETLEENIGMPEPPDYLLIGRGLVYNCVGKHWACVDKKSYFKCAKNLKESQKRGKVPACAVVAVYTSDDDCQVIQTYNVNTSQPVEFCK